MSKRRIKKIAIIGSGIMGSGIACHFANIGVDVLLLDIVPRELNNKEKAKGLTLEDKVVLAVLLWVRMVRLICIPVWVV